MARLVLLALLGVLAGATVTNQVQKVTPVEKVIELLEKLEKKVESEGKEEAKAYDKFACFCKEQADEKLYAKEKSTAKIAELDAQIAELGAEITKLNGEINDLGRTIDNKVGNIKFETERRERNHAFYLERAAEIEGAIKAINGAIDALTTAKGDMAGKTNTNALLQVKEAAALGFALVQKSSKSALSQTHTSILKKLAQPGEAYESEFHSNDIISMLEDLKDKATDMQNENDKFEFEDKAEFDSILVDLENEKQFAEKDKAEKEALQQKKTDAEAKAKEDRMQEQAEFDADSAFLKTLTADCEEKAMLWDQRSKMRAGELQAIDEAMTALKEGVKPNYGANKKLNGLVQKGAAPSFLQVRSAASKEAAMARSVEKVEAFLLQKARETKSGILSAAALRIEVSEDHFVKVRTLIKDLLSKLKDDAEAEAEQKGFCDKNMKEAVDKRDANQGAVESLTAVITQLNAEDKQLDEEIADLTAGVAANMKAKKEATALRDEDKAENEQTIIDSDQGKKAVDFALQTLQEFYGGAAGGAKFVQVAPRNSAANMDRDGNTVADMAPEVFSSDYKGSQSNSKGIVGMLEVISSDFDRTIETTQDAEEDEASKHETFVRETDADTTSKEGAIKTKKNRKVEIKEELTIRTDLKTEAAGQLKDALEELEILHSKCVAGQETYAERVEARNKEIAALKEAHAILEDWQGL